jgi:hypothetical protein
VVQKYLPVYLKIGARQVQNSNAYPHVFGQSNPMELRGIRSDISGSEKSCMAAAKPESFYNMACNLDLSAISTATSMFTGCTKRLLNDSIIIECTHLSDNNMFSS